MRRCCFHALLGLSFAVSACSGTDDATDDEQKAQWQVVQDELPGGLLSVWGRSSTDVWTVGADADGSGPTVLHFDGSSWQALSTSSHGDLLWIFGFEDGPIYMGGEGGTILRYVDGAVSAMETPSTEETIFGIWGSSPENVWAVGGHSGGSNGAFAWRLQGDRWLAVEHLPADWASRGAIWKAFGRNADDAWLVGTNGEAAHWDGNAFEPGDTGVSESLFTVHANRERFAAVGGFGTGVILENEGDGWVDRSPKSAPPLVGVYLDQDVGYAVGQFGAVLERTPQGWKEVDTGVPLDQTLHSVWVDETGGVWTVGGDVLTKPLVRGVMLHRGAPVATGLR